MAYRLNIKPDLAEMIRHLHPDRKKKMRQSFEFIAENPLSGKPLQEDLIGLFSWRVDSWRTIYSIDSQSKTVHVLALGPRDTIYEAIEKDLTSARLKK